MAITKKVTINCYELPLEIRAEEMGGYFARCSDWDACYAQGETVDEVLSEITQIARALLEIYQEEGLEIPLKRMSQRRKKFSLRVPIEARSDVSL